MFLEWILLYLWTRLSGLVPTPDPLALYLIIYESARITKYSLGHGPLYTVWYYGLVNLIITIYANLWRPDPRGGWGLVFGFVFTSDLLPLLSLNSPLGRGPCSLLGAIGHNLGAILNMAPPNWLRALGYGYHLDGAPGASDIAGLGIFG